MVSDQKELWSEYCRLHKDLVRQKKIWNDVIDRANAHFEGSRKEFWAFDRKGRRKNFMQSLACGKSCRFYRVITSVQVR